MLIRIAATDMDTISRWKTHGLAALILLILTISVMARLSPHGSATSPDSLAYLDIAAHMRAGEGWRATDFSFEAANRPATVDNRIWPPLYPAVLAGFIDHPLDTVGAARLSNVLYFFVALLTFCLLAREVMWIKALGLTIPLMLATPALTIFAYAWSEGLFVLLLLLAATGATGYLSACDREPRLRALWATLLTLSLIALFLTRYIGIVFAFLLPLTFWWSRRDGEDRRVISVASVVYGAPVAFLLWRNSMLTGSVTGGSRDPSDLSLAENLLHVGESLATGFPIFPHEWVIAALGGLAVAVAITRHDLRFPSVMPSSRQVPAAATLAAIGSAYLLALVMMRTHTRFDQIDMRLIAPALLPGMLAATLWAIRQARLLPMAAVLALVAAGGISGFGPLQRTAEAWKTTGSPGFSLRGRIGYNNFTPGPGGDGMRAAFRNLLPAGAVLVVPSRPVVWRFLSGVRTVELPTALEPEFSARLHRLPAGSALLLKPGKEDAVMQFLVQGRDYAEVIPLGDHILLRLGSAVQSSP